MNTWHRLLNGLAEKQIRYVLVGGMAVNLHGVPRLTANAAGRKQDLADVEALGQVERIGKDEEEKKPGS